MTKPRSGVALPADVLAFWFGEPPRDGDEALSRIRRWFLGGEAMDLEVRERFATTVEAALAGELEGWAATIHGRLALVLVIDQFTRNVYRGDAKTYAGDAMAQRVALEAFDRGLDAELSYVERAFLAMPLLHAENVDLQQRSVAIAADPGTVPEVYQAMQAMRIEQSHKYRDIIQRFGRFPHRNAILGRSATAEETAFLDDWEAKARPQGMRS
jgi:uncharacterized protein (DUF924 family)